MHRAVAEWCDEFRAFMASGRREAWVTDAGLNVKMLVRKRRLTIEARERPLIVLVIYLVSPAFRALGALENAQAIEDIHECVESYADHCVMLKGIREKRGYYFKRGYVIHATEQTPRGETYDFALIR